MDINGVISFINNIEELANIENPNKYCIEKAREIAYDISKVNSDFNISIVNAGLLFDINSVTILVNNNGKIITNTGITTESSAFIKDLILGNRWIVTSELSNIIDILNFENFYIESSLQENTIIGIASNITVERLRMNYGIFIDAKES